MDKKMEELLGRMKAAKTAEEVMAIAKEMPRIELSEESLSNVAGGTGRIELTEEQAERVAGGGHYITDSMGSKIWIELMDIGYQPGEGTDPLYDRAYMLETMAVAGFPMDVLIKVGNQLFPLKSYSIHVAEALRSGGPVYLADCVRSANGFHF